jgi:glycosyltransferase involved in cell wall biosynthesis
LTARLGVVAIGRNEGERLRRCLDSVTGRADAVVYVDSGSIDDSVDYARRKGALVVELDRSVPFTAARARNAGLERLLAAHPDLPLVQFVDGDCQVVDGWLERAAAELTGDAELAVVCGRRRERHPEASIYNRLCDIEWDTPVGPAEACGGDAMMRTAPLGEIGGYDPELIAGEEPDLCLRLRQRGWKILRIDAEMTLHDAAMTRFGQWWRRTLRAGHAYAEGAARHGDAGYCVRETRSIWFWGLGVPAAALALAGPTGGLSLLLLGGYVVLAVRVYGTMQGRGFSPRDAALYAASCAVGKIPMALGQALYWTRRLSGRRGRLIEYKG